MTCKDFVIKTGNADKRHYLSEYQLTCYKHDNDLVIVLLGAFFLPGNDSVPQYGTSLQPHLTILFS